MKLPQIAIENYQFTIVMTVMLALTGIISLLTMPRSEDPPVAPLGTSIIVIYPGASPIDIEHMIVDPIEEALNELNDIKELNSTAEDGLATIEIEFMPRSGDPDDKYDRVVQKVNSIRDDLPADIFNLEMIKWEISTVNILQMALVSETAAYRRMEKEAESLKKRWERIPGVRKVETWAVPQQEIRVAINLEKLAQMKVPLAQVLGVIQGGAANIPGGHIDVGDKRFNVVTSGDYDSIEDIRRLIIHAGGGRVVYLADVADVAFTYEDQKYLARYNGQRCLFITATQKKDTNIFTIMDRLKAAAVEFRTRLDPEMNLYSVFDQSESVAQRVNGFFSNLLQGVVLVGLVVLLAVGFRASMIVMLAIPLSILLASGWLDLSGYGLEQMSIVGFVIALGLLVDNAIVVTENVSRFMKKGLPAQVAAARGTAEIAWPIVSSTATTVLAFIPIIMIRDVTGDFIRSMPVTVVFTLTASLLLALTLSPYLAGKLLGQRADRPPRYFERMLTTFSETTYRRWLKRALRHPTIVLLIAGIVFFSSLALFPYVGVSFFPLAEKPQFMININTPQGSSLDHTDKTAAYVESVLAARPEVKHWAANVGRGNPRIYYNVISKHEQSTHAQLYVELNTRSRRVMDRVIRELRREFANFPNARIAVKEFEQGPPVGAPIEVRVFGESLSQLRTLSIAVEDIVRAAPGVVNVDNPLRTTKTDLHVNINRDKAGLLGVRLVEIDRTVRAAVAGLNVASFRDEDGENYNIAVRMPTGANFAIPDFDRIFVTSVMGSSIPLSQVAKIEFKASPTRINHYLLDRMNRVTADVQRDVSVNDVTQAIIRRLDGLNWPKGYSYSIGGELESREESFGGMGQAVLAALIAIFGVLVLQFRSFVQPLIVFSAIPLAVIGSIAALFITGHSFSFTAFVGITSLVGIVINNSIILVDYTNQLRQQGKHLLAALPIAARTRFTPILLTTLTTIGGLLPLTLQGGTLWAPMGWTIIGGLLVSTFLTLLVVPVLYRLLSRW